MIIGNAAWGFRETPLEKQLEITRDMGLDLLELQIGGHENDFLQLDATAEDIAKVKDLFEQYAIKLICASTGNDFTAATEVDCADVKRVIDIAEQLNIKYLRIFAGFSPVAEVIGERWDVMIKMLNEVAQYAQEHNILPAIETHGGVEECLDGIRHFHSTTTSMETWRRILDELDYPVGVVFDPANLGAVGMNETEIIDLYRLLPVSYLHLKDFRKTPQEALEPCACGAGQLDWQKLWSELKNFSGPGVIEYELTEDIEDGLRRSLEFL
jgi:sugar phosphate isomerase/epimerase